MRSDLQAGPRRAREGRASGAPDQRHEQDQRRAAADQHELADRIGRDQPFADRVVEREQEHAEQHQADAGKRGASAAVWRHGVIAVAGVSGASRAAACSRQKM